MIKLKTLDNEIIVTPTIFPDKRRNKRLKRKWKGLGWLNLNG